jgi:hypothetical protein
MDEYRVALTPEQVELITALVEASKSVRQEFMILRTMQGPFIRHPAFPGGQLDVYEPDFQAIEDLGLLTITHYDSRTGKSTVFEVSPQGRHVYEYAHTESQSPQGSVEEDIRRFIDSDSFKRIYPSALERWQAAARLLWADDAGGQLTEVGHYCREALQEFADVVSAGLPVHDDSTKVDTVKRIRAALDAHEEAVGATASEMLKALLAYWGTVSDLAQRQEHAAAREGAELKWEDARRLVFQTLVLMYELDRAINRGA